MGGAWGQVSGAEILKRNVTPTPFDRVKSIPGGDQSRSFKGGQYPSDGPRTGSHGNLRGAGSHGKDRRGVQYRKQGSSEEKGRGQRLRVDQYNRSVSDNSFVRGRGKRRGGGAGVSEPTGGYSRSASNRTRTN